MLHPLDHRSSQMNPKLRNPGSLRNHLAGHMPKYHMILKITLTRVVFGQEKGKKEAVISAKKLQIDY